MIYFRWNSGRRLSGAAMIDLSNAVLDRKASFRFRAGGRSMDPFIKDGDTLTLSHLSQVPVGMGDVVAFLHPVNKQFTIHRIVNVWDGGYQIKGDNRAAADGFLRREELLGKVIRVERSGRPVFLVVGFGGRAIALLSRWGVWTLIRQVFSRLKKRYTVKLAEE